MRLPGPYDLGLRSRLVLVLGLGSLLLCAVASAATWWLSAGYLEPQRTQLGTQLAVDSAIALQQGLSTARGVPPLLERTRPESGEGLLRQRGERFTSSLTITPSDLPQGFREAAVRGAAVRQLTEVNGSPRLVIGLPLATGATYVAVLPLDELDATLRTLSVVLTTVSLLTATAFTALGAWASRRALRPLVNLNEAAAAVAAGHLDTDAGTGGTRGLPVAGATGLTRLRNILDV